MASLAPVLDLNKIVFGMGIGLSYEYLVKQFTLLLFWFARTTSKPIAETDPLANAEFTQIAKKL
jgi:hypothetical protein